MLDTIFMALRNKRRQVSFLHIYHHTTVLIFWGSTLVYNRGYAYGCFAALINSFIHFIMYSHYFITSIGYKNPFKKYLTSIQIVQFYTGITVAIISVLYDKEYGVMVPGGCAIYISTLVILFTSFYNKSYNKSVKKTS